MQDDDTIIDENGLNLLLDHSNSPVDEINCLAKLVSNQAVERSWDWNHNESKNKTLLTSLKVPFTSCKIVKWWCYQKWFSWLLSNFLWWSVYFAINTSSWENVWRKCLTSTTVWFILYESWHCLHFKKIFWEIILSQTESC